MAVEEPVLVMMSASFDWGRNVPDHYLQNRAVNRRKSRGNSDGYNSECPRYQFAKYFVKSIGCVAVRMAGRRVAVGETALTKPAHKDRHAAKSHDWCDSLASNNAAV
jgi:hypothetical protein